MPLTPLPPDGPTTTADLSPPSSQGAPGIANANGKRPLSTTDNAPRPATRSSMNGGAMNAPAETEEIKTHQPSGYKWTKAVDEPGHAWKNKRAQEETERAWGMVLHKERKIGNRFGDPFEMADAEAAMLATGTKT